LSSRNNRFPKTLSYSPDAGSLRMIVPETYSPSHKCMLTNRIKQWRRRKPRCVGCSCLFVGASSITTTRICREDLPRVTGSQIRVGFSIKHVLDMYSHIKNKQQKEVADLRGFGPDFGRPFACTSCACDGICGSWLLVGASSVATACIYRVDPPRIIGSHNRLVFSIKHILDTDS
jgi:hypothetical protein